MKIICVANTSDFNRVGRWIPASTRPTDKTNPKSSGSPYADMSLYWSRQDCLILSPVAFEPSLIRYSDRLLNRNSTPVLSLPTDTGMGAVAAAKPEVIEQIVDFLDGDEGDLRPWGVTEHIYDLVAAIEAAGGRVCMNEAPARRHAALIEELDSKAGFRQFVDELQSGSVRIRMPEGQVCASKHDVSATVATLIETNAECVVKSNVGSGGSGVLIVQASPGRDTASLVTELEARMEKRRTVFHSGPYVVERRVSLPEGNLGHVGATSVNALIGPDGTARIIGWGREVRDQSNHHVGAPPSVVASTRRSA
jgi:hypothetical protein